MAAAVSTVRERAVVLFVELLPHPHALFLEYVVLAHRIPWPRRSHRLDHVLKGRLVVSTEACHRPSLAEHDVGVATHDANGCQTVAETLRRKLQPAGQTVLPQ